MKKLVILLMSFTSLSYVSCSDAIDIAPEGLLTPENAFRTLEDLQLGINTVYARMGNETELEFASVFTDEVSIGLENGGQGLIDGEFSFILNSGSAAPVGIWASNYSILNMANRVIASAEFINYDPETEQVAFDNLLAQAYALRAYAHFKLISYFSTNPADDNALGVMKLDFVPPSNVQLPRVPNGEIYELIQSDLVTASSLLSPASTNNTFVTANFITALNARMALYRGQYGAAEGFADLLISAVPLAPRVAYQNIYLDSPIASEVIFKVRRVNLDFRVGSLWASVDASPNGSPFYEVSRALFNTLSLSDVRRNVIVHPNSLVDPNYLTNPNYVQSDVITLNKYRGTTFNLLADIKIFRVSEMHLIKAEAQANAGNLNGATNSVAATLQGIRNIRIAPNQPLPVYASATEAWADILLERRKELAFEGHRYLDIKRLGTKANAGVSRDPRDCEINNSCSLPATDHRIVSLPIPITELTANSAIRPQQNPGYSN